MHVPIRTSHAKQLNAIQQNIELIAGIKVDGFFLADESELNAFAYSNAGKTWLVINRGLLYELQNDQDAIAALIGHELAHVAAGHASARQNINATVSTGSQILGFVANSFIPGSGLLVGTLGQAISQAYSRTQELEADELGLSFATKAGYDPTGSIRLFNKLPTQKEQYGGFFNSHPSKKERIERLENLIKIHSKQ